MIQKVFAGLLMTLIPLCATVGLLHAAEPLPGQYVSAAGLPHPFVFAKPAEYRALLTRRTVVTARVLAELQNLVQRELTQGAAYTQTYNGCDLNVYLYKLTYEVGGAAKAASDLALYAYLSNLQLGYGQASLAAQAQTLAKSILLRWAGGGFRDNGRMRTLLTDFCEGGAVTKASKIDIGLQLGRGVPDLIQAEDLLDGINAFTASEHTVLDGFLTQLDHLLLNASNFFSENINTECVRYSNHKAVQILAMLAIERYQNDAADFVDTASVGRRLQIPWTTEIAGGIYGIGDSVRPCMHNTTTATGGHGAFYQIGQVAPGEVVDRFRAGADQTLGYPIFSLTELMLSAEILQNAGFLPMSFKGPKGQSLPMALQYYSYYFTTFLTPGKSIVTAKPNGRQFPSQEQYIGHPVSGPEGITIEGQDSYLLPFLIGYHLDPHDPGSLAVIRRAISFLPKITPFYKVYSIAYNCLIGLPLTSGSP